MQDRLRQKKDLILTQEDLIRSLAKEVKSQQKLGGDQETLRSRLIEVVEKSMERDQLLHTRETNLPQIQQSKEEASLLKNLQEEEMVLDAQVAEVQHEMNALERPSTAVKASYLA